MGWPAKNNKTKKSRFYDFRIEMYKKKRFKVLKFIWFIGLFICKIAFLVIYNSKVIKSRIFCFVVLSWPPHLSILHPYLKLSAPDVVRNLNVKVFNLMSRTNETRHIE